MQVFHRFSDSCKSSQSISLIYEFAWLAGFSKSEENLLKTSCKVVPATKVAHIFWWRHNNRKQSASAREHWCDVSCDIPYWRILLLMDQSVPECTCSQVVCSALVDSLGFASINIFRVQNWLLSSFCMSLTPSVIFQLVFGTFGAFLCCFV